MSIIHRLTVSVATVALGLTVSAGPVFAQPAHILVPADRVQWGPAPAVLPAGAELSVLEGNPSEKGPVTMRLRMPAGYDIPPHWHSMTERVTVLSGALHVGMGDTLDRDGSQTLEPGGYVSIPATMHHFAWTSAPTVVQIALEGPFDIVYVHPTEELQRGISGTQVH